MAALAVSPHLAATPLTPPQRAQILGLIPACVSEQRKAAENTKLKDKVITEYCNCIYYSIADRVQDEDIVESNRGNTAKISKIRDNAADACGKKAAQRQQ